VLTSMGESIVARAKAAAPVKTGKLKESIAYQVRGNKLVAGPTVPYAPYMEFGTATRGEFGGPPYIITPRKAQYLRFQINGKWITTKRVVHPGVAARPFMRPAVQEALGGLTEKLLERGVMLIIKGPNA
jgi:HK97 gp10 family phage protein